MPARIVRTYRHPESSEMDNQREDEDLRRAALEASACGPVLAVLLRYLQITHSSFVEIFVTEACRMPTHCLELSEQRHLSVAQQHKHT